MDKLQVVDSSTVCAVLSISDRTLRTWVSDLGCPSNKEGRTVTFNWSDVLFWYVDYAAAKKGFNMRQLHTALWERVTKLHEAGRLPQTPTPGWTARTDKLNRALGAALQSRSSESSEASRSQQNASRPRRLKRRIARRPGMSWIREN